SNKTYYKRALPHNYFLKITGITDINFFILQKEAINTNLSNVENLCEKLADFSVTAAVINNLDLIISVDTSIAHLAGAMGKESWVLLPIDPDWRWLTYRRNSPWYSQLSLFRQKKPGDWNSVFTEVYQE